MHSCSHTRAEQQLFLEHSMFQKVACFASVSAKRFTDVRSESSNDEKPIELLRIASRGLIVTRKTTRYFVLLCFNNH